VRDPSRADRRDDREPLRDRKSRLPG